MAVGRRCAPDPPYERPPSMPKAWLGQAPGVSQRLLCSVASHLRHALIGAGNDVAETIKRRTIAPTKPIEPKIRR